MAIASEVRPRRRLLVHVLGCGFWLHRAQLRRLNVRAVGVVSDPFNAPPASPFSGIQQQAPPVPAAGSNPFGPGAQPVQPQAGFKPAPTPASSLTDPFQLPSGLPRTPPASSNQFGGPPMLSSQPQGTRRTLAKTSQLQL